MDVAMVAVVGVGVIGMISGYVFRHDGGRSQLFVGAAMITGPMSLLLKGRVTEEVPILLTGGAVALALVGLVVAIAQLRQRLVHRVDDSPAH